MTVTGRLLRFTFLPVFVVMAWRLFGRLDRHAVNVPFWDHWEYLVGYMTDAGLLEMFRWQHGPHRQGVGFLVTKLVGDATQLDLRAESFAIGGILCVAAGLALWLKRRMFGSFHWADFVIPLVFLSPIQWEMLTATPNPAHGAIPLLLVVAVGLAWTIRTRGARYLLIVLLTACLTHTGFGLFAGAVVPLLLGLEARRESLRPDGRPRAPMIALLSTVFISCAFFIGYEFTSGQQAYRFPDPDWPNYPTVVARALSGYLWVRDELASPLGFLILAGSIWVGVQHVLRLRPRFEPAEPTSTHQTVVLFLLLFSLLFSVNMAIGRISFGLNAGTASRYTTLLTPLYFGLYLHAHFLSGKRKTALLTIIVLAHLHGSMLPHAAIESQSATIHRLKVVWRDTYLATASIEAADLAAGASVCQDPKQTALRRKLEFLESRELSFFRDHVVTRPLDPNIVGRWMPQGSKGAAASCTLLADGSYQFDLPTADGHREGRWQVVDGILSIRHRGTVRWLSFGRYTLAGDTMRLVPAAGRSALIWQRM